MGTEPTVQHQRLPSAKRPLRETAAPVQVIAESFAAPTYSSRVRPMAMEMHEAIDFSIKKRPSGPKASGSDDKEETAFKHGVGEATVTSSNADSSPDMAATPVGSTAIRNVIPTPWMHPLEYLLSAAGIYQPPITTCHQLLLSPTPNIVTSSSILNQPTPPFPSNTDAEPSNIPVSCLLRRRREYHSRNEEERSSSGEPSSKRSSGDESKDEIYWERRRKNNAAAKRSRDARRVKEEEIALRAAFLEQENLKLKAQVAVLKNETTRLHCLLFSHVKTTP